MAPGSDFSFLRRLRKVQMKTESHGSVVEEFLCTPRVIYEYFSVTLGNDLTFLI